VLIGSTVIVVTAATALSSMALMAAFLTLTVVEAESVPLLDAGFAVGSSAVHFMHRQPFEGPLAI
jgi:hypothetical protein